MRESSRYRRIWFLGDSLTAGYDASEESLCFRSLAALLLEGVLGEVMSFSANQYGGTVNDGVRQALADLGFMPDVAVIQFGENDRPYSPDFAVAYARLIAQLRREGRRTLVAAFSVWAPSPDTDSLSTNADIRELVEEAGGVFVDIQAAASDPVNRQAGRDVSWLNDSGHTLSDGFHPNDAGHRALAEGLVSALAPKLKAGPTRLSASVRPEASVRTAATGRPAA